MKLAQTASPLLLLLAAGCGILDPDRSRGQLDRAKAKWAEANLTSYDYVIQRLCFCGNVDPVRITVVNGQVVARVDTVTGQPLGTGESTFYPDIPGLFQVIEDAYQRADAINVTFDQIYGYPTSAVIDYVKNAVDDELTLKAAELHFTSAPQ